mgnify:CR=1 FL=1
MQDALKRFRKDAGIIKIGIEHYLNHDIAEADRLIACFKENFPDRKKDVRNYEIISALNKKEYDLASELFQKYFSPEILSEYWNFLAMVLFFPSVRTGRTLSDILTVWEEAFTTAPFKLAEPHKQDNTTFSARYQWVINFSSPMWRAIATPSQCRICATKKVWINPHSSATMPR